MGGNFILPDVPPLLMGRATPAQGAPERPVLTPAAPPPRPKTQEAAVAPGEIMSVPIMAAALFQGAAPKEGQALEFVCVRADDKGWGLALRVKSDGSA